MFWRLHALYPDTSIHSIRLHSLGPLKLSVFNLEAYISERPVATQDTRASFKSVQPQCPLTVSSETTQNKSRDASTHVLGLSKNSSSLG